MSQEILQGHLNAKKEETLSVLRERGKYIEFSEENGFVYQLEFKLPFSEQVSQLMLSMKNGWITVLEM
ncbi:hypothetical protein V6B14_22055 (plasmid) [Sporosarcina psychrophila]|uniref:hypothetical protein n=1 Tax=Sporosarcina psychrophila TaxID=1476 RepID=UPI0030D17D31